MVLKKLRVLWFELQISNYLSYDLFCYFSASYYFWSSKNFCALRMVLQWSCKSVANIHICTEGYYEGIWGKISKPTTICRVGGVERVKMTPGHLTHACHFGFKVDHNAELKGAGRGYVPLMNQNDERGQRQHYGFRRRLPQFRGLTMRSWFRGNGARRGS